MIDRRPHPRYAAPLPGAPTTHPCFYLKPQTGYHGLTPQFMVMRLDSGGPRILAEHAFLDDGIAIVDALRHDHGIITFGRTGQAS